MASRAQRRRAKRANGKATFHNPRSVDEPRSEWVQLRADMKDQLKRGMTFDQVADAHGVTKAEVERAEQAAEDTILKPMNGTGEIHLYSPAAEHFEAFVVGNATKCDRVVPLGTAIGKTVVICGAGPSLRETAEEWCPEGDEVWGANSALMWLWDNGHAPTHGITVDQTPMMLKDWISPPPVEYLIASTVHPHLVEYLELKNRRMTFFHNFVGMKKPPVAWEDESGAMRTESYEDWMYMMLYPGTVRAGSGLNSVTRAVDVALYRGFSRIILLGADHAMHATGKMPDDIDASEHNAWLEANTEFHVDGGSAIKNGQSPLVLQGEIDGRLWTTKPDLMISAVQIAKWIKDGVVECVGDTLPNALKDKDDDFIARLPKLATTEGEPINLPWQTACVTAAQSVK